MKQKTLASSKEVVVPHHLSQLSQPNKLLIDSSKTVHITPYPLAVKVQLPVPSSENKNAKTEIQLVPDVNYLNDKAFKETLGFTSKQCFEFLLQQSKDEKIRQALKGEIRDVLLTLTEQKQLFEVLSSDLQKQWLFQKDRILRVRQIDFCSLRVVYEAYLRARIKGALPLSQYRCDSSFRVVSGMATQQNLLSQEQFVEVWIWEQAGEGWSLSMANKDDVSCVAAGRYATAEKTQQAYRVHLAWIPQKGYGLLREVTVAPENLLVSIDEKKILGNQASEENKHTKRSSLSNRKQKEKIIEETDEENENENEGSSSEIFSSQNNFHRDAIFEAVKKDNALLLQVLLAHLIPQKLSGNSSKNLASIHREIVDTFFQKFCTYLVSEKSLEEQQSPITGEKVMTLLKTYVEDQLRTMKYWEINKEIFNGLAALSSWMNVIALKRAIERDCVEIIEAGLKKQLSKTSNDILPRYWQQLLLASCTKKLVEWKEEKTDNEINLEIEDFSILSPQHFIALQALRYQVEESGIPIDTLLPKSYRQLYESDAESFWLALKCWHINPNIRDDKGNTLTHSALKHRSQETLRVLSDYQIDQMKETNEAGEMPLIYASIPQGKPHYEAHAFHWDGKVLIRLESTFIQEVEMVAKTLRKAFDEVKKSSPEEMRYDENIKEAEEVLEAIHEALEKVKRSEEDTSLYEDIKNIRTINIVENKPLPLENFYLALQECLQRYETDELGAYALKWPVAETRAQQEAKTREIKELKELLAIKESELEKKKEEVASCLKLFREQYKLKKSNEIDIACGETRILNLIQESSPLVQCAPGENPEELPRLSVEGRSGGKELPHSMFFANSISSITTRSTENTTRNEVGNLATQGIENRSLSENQLG